ncbi:MAG: hypothetical protein RI932_2525 [Pseudomonadota bacterium]|jgi:3-deoxy-D-manno-octulosonic-acid transferase
MILRLLALLSSTLHLPMRILCRIPSSWLNSEKANIFLQERRRSILENKISTAKAALQNAKTQEKKAVYWIHVASAGELEQAIPVLRELHSRYGIYFFLTYFSPSARSFTKNCPGLLAATSLPPEDTHAYEMIISSLQIRRLLLVRYDFWPTLVFTAKKNHVAVAVLAATLNRARSPLPPSFQRRLRCFWFEQTDLIFLVSAEDKKELLALDIAQEKLHIAGDAKWQRAKERAEQAKAKAPDAAMRKLSALFPTSGSQSFEQVLVFGSPHEEELSTLELCMREFIAKELVIVAPAEVDKHNIESLQLRLQRSGASVHLLSSESAETLEALSKTPQNKSVLILDGFGYLAEAYRYADVAIVGGGFDGQLHNVLEPAAYPVLTLYGNQFERAPEARLLLNRKAAVGFANTNELFQFLQQWSSLKRPGGENLPWAQSLEQTLKNAQDVFGSLPDTSEVVCRALAAQDKLETT